MCDLQTPEGQYPEIAPVGGGFGGITYECASIFMAWELYEQYGDIRTLEKFYPGMQKYMDYMKDKGLPGTKVNPAIGPLGDWLAPEETDLLLLWNAFYYKEADLMSRIADALGRTEEQHQYEALAAKVKKFWNETFVLPDSGKTCNADGTLCDTQCSYAIALSYGVAEDRKRIGEHLIRKTRAIGHTVGTGFFGTGILNQMLTEQGAVEDDAADGIPVVAVSGDPGSDDDLGALGFLHEGKRLRRTECDELVQSLFSRKRSFLAVSHGTWYPERRDKTGLSAHSAETAAGPARVYERFRRQPVRSDFCRMGAER